MSDEVFPHGRWTVKPGREDEFIVAWTDFAKWSKANVPGARWVVLLRDQQQRNIFISVGPWEGTAAVEAWRASDGFRSRIGRIRELLDAFEAMTLDPVARLD